MLSFTLPVLFSLIHLLNTAAQPYKAIEHFLLDCGSSTSTTITSDQRWVGDESSGFLTSNTTNTSFSSRPSFQDPSVPEVPYFTARIFNSSSFTYIFPVSRGPKFLRLYFYPATYPHLKPNQSFFSVSSNGYSLLTNFSAFLVAPYVGRTLSSTGLDGPKVPHLIKEFIIYVKDSPTLNVTFTPSPNSYAFINGIEIVSIPENLYVKDKNLKYVGLNSGPVIGESMALENMYRLNVGGSQISANNDTGMYRSWDQDDNYIFPASAIGLTPVSTIPIRYTLDTPSYTAPELVYQTQRSMGSLSKLYNLTWTLPVDSGFFYLVRLHFCNIIPQYTKRGQVVFRIFINNQTAEEEADLFYWTQGSGYPVFKDYILYINDFDGLRSKKDLWLVMHTNRDGSEEYADVYLNGLEVFKLSMDQSLASPNPELDPIPTLPRPLSNVKENKKRTPHYAAIFGGAAGSGLVLIFVIIVIFIWHRRVKRLDTSIESKSTQSRHPETPSGHCRRFSLREVKVATGEFNDSFVIGNGGFGKVYKGYIDDAKTVVAIKRLNSSSKQGIHEFKTEIGMLSKLRHIQLVPLIGYCHDKGEMILVYEYMAHGTLREHLYKTKDPPLIWKKRLEICIGAAKGLHYLHVGANRTIIHRDVKSTNILLDENWVAKLSDFGLSKLGPKDQTQNHVNTMVKGTVGYMDPEYYRSRQLTDKSDVYSFGVVLLEVLCARPVVNQRLPDEQVSLAEWGRSHIRKGTLSEIIDTNLSGEIAPKCLMKFGEVAGSCLKEDGSKRPSMEEVVWGLELALKLQEAAEQTSSMVGVSVLEDEELMLVIKGKTPITDDYSLFGSTGAAIKHGTSLTDSRNKGLESEIVFTHLLEPERG